MLRLGTCLLFTGLARAVNVYLHPSPLNDLPSELSPEQATLELSKQLGLELFESADFAYNHGYSVYEEQLFVGQGERSGLLLSLNVNGVGANDVLLHFPEPSFTLNTPPMSTLSSLISTYLHRASHIYAFVYSGLSSPPSATPRLLDIFSVTSPSTTTFLSEISTLSEFLDDPSSSKFAALELNGLSQIASTYGLDSEQYQTASATLRAFLSAATSQSSNINLALLTHTPSPSSKISSKRQPPQSPLPPSVPPQEPIGSVSTCHLTSDLCNNATNKCTGRGECVQATKAGRTCWICTCGQTVTERGKKETWVGEMCERKDISGPFVLITGAVIGLILLMGGSVALLYGVGEQELPSTLLAGAAPGKKD